MSLKDFICTPDCTILHQFLKNFSGEAPLTPPQWRIQRVHCRGGVTKSARGAAGGGCGRGIPLPAGGGPGASPGKIFWKMDANGAFWAHFLPSSCRISPKKFCVIFAFKAPFQRSYKAKEGDFFSSSTYGGGGGSGSPRENFWKTDANGAFLAYFCRVRVDFSPKIVCNFCFQISDLLYTWCGRMFILAVEEKPKRGIFYLLAVGGSGSPRENFWKTDANGAFWAHFCRVRVDSPPPKKKLCVIVSFKTPISMMREIFFLLHGGEGGGAGESSRFFFFFFFWKTDTNDTFWLHS